MMEAEAGNAEGEVSQDSCCLSSAVVCGKLFVHMQSSNSKNKS